jgi:imidazole glycerol-phosphate synthase subunit HisF
MAKHIRVIPQLNIKGNNIVKPVHTEALRIIGDPYTYALKYFTEGADELIYLDVVASLYQRNLDFNLLQYTARDVFIPMTVGGGIRSINDINAALRAGADKVAINTYAIQNPDFLKSAIQYFGSQCIVLYIEAKKMEDGVWEAYTDGGREKTGINAIEWAKQAIDFGVGEILITSIDKDGTKKGYDIELIQRVTAFAPIPVIAHGGAKDADSFVQVVDATGVDAVSASSVFHYALCSIPEVKLALRERGYDMRI